MKRVLQVVGKMNVGGAETLLMNVYRNIDRSRVQFDFLTFYQPGETGVFDDEIRELGGHLINLRKPFPLTIRRNIKDIMSVLDERHYDAVHTHIGNNSAYALAAAKRKGIPIRIAHSHNMGRRKPALAKGLQDAFLNKMLNRSLTACCACSKKAGEYLFDSENMGCKYSFIPNAIDFQPFLDENNTAAVREKLGVSEDTLLLLQVGNFHPAKNQEFSVKILRELLDKGVKCVLLFAGAQDAYAEKVRSLANDLKVSQFIRFLGARSDVSDLMHAADVFLMPSIREGLGIALLEAQASGCLCIVSSNIQPEAIISTSNVIECNLSDIDEWTSQIFINRYRKRPMKETRRKLVTDSIYQLNSVISLFYRLYNA